MKIRLAKISIELCKIVLSEKEMTDKAELFNTQIGE